MNVGFIYMYRLGINYLFLIFVFDTPSEPEWKKKEKREDFSALKEKGDKK